MADYLFLIPALPLLAFAINFLLGRGLIGDKAHTMIFDNTKVKRLVPDYVAKVPFVQGAREIMAWYDADPSRQTVNEEFNRLTNTIIEAQRRAMPTTAQEENR